MTIRRFKVKGKKKGQGEQFDLLFDLNSYQTELLPDVVSWTQTLQSLPCANLPFLMLGIMLTQTAYHTLASVLAF